MTDEERDVLERAVAIAKRSMAHMLRVGPQKVECVEMRCHPDDEAEIRARFQAAIVVDPEMKRGTLAVIPLGYAKSIKATIGFAIDAKAPR